MIGDAKVVIPEDMGGIHHVHDSETSHSINAAFGVQFECYFAVWMWPICLQLDRWNILNQFSIMDYH